MIFSKRWKALILTQGVDLQKIFIDFPRIIKVWLICRNAVRAMSLAISIIYFNLRLWLFRHDVMFNAFSAIDYL